MGDDAFEELRRIRDANRQQRLDRIAKAKLAQPMRKEAFDLRRMKKISATNAIGKMSDEDLTIWLEEKYYVEHPRLTTLAQLAEVVEQYARWS